MHQPDTSDTTSTMTNWTYSVRKHFTKRLGALVGVPFAQPHEAPNSWFMRAAAFQGCSPKEFASYLGFNFRCDFDFQYHYAFSRESPYALEVQNLASGLAFYPRSRSTGRPMYGLGGRGRYRFCSLCLRDQQVPCIHLYCRMQELIFCPWHRCLLEERCPHCDASLELSRDMMMPMKGMSGIEDMSWCLLCQQPLHTAPPVFIDPQFLWAMPFWLREWGKGGPTPIEGAGLDSSALSQQRARLLHMLSIRMDTTRHSHLKTTN